VHGIFPILHSTYHANESYLLLIKLASDYPPQNNIYPLKHLIPWRNRNELFFQFPKYNQLKDWHFQTHYRSISDFFQDVPPIW